MIYASILPLIPCFLRKIIPLIPILQGKNTPLIPFFCLYKGLLAFLISANLYHGGRRGVWFRALCGVLRTRSTFRAADSLLSCKDSRYCYVDKGAW